LTIISRTFLPLTVVFFGAGNLNRGYFLAAAFFAVVTAAVLSYRHLGAKERYQPPEKKSRGTVSCVAAVP
jgi:Na+/melibiose symporter-like transporter